MVGDDGDDGGDVVDGQVGRVEGEVRAAAHHRQEHDPFQNRQVSFRRLRITIKGE